MRRRKYGPRRHRLVIRVYRHTRSITEAAKATGMSHTWAYRILVRAGEINSHPPVFSIRVATEAVTLYRTGLSCRSVAELLAQKYSPAPSQQWVFMRVQEAGALRSKSRAMELRESQRQGKDFDSIRRKAVKLAAEKLWSVRMIAEHLGVSKKVVSRALPPALRADPSLATERRMWQAYLPDVEARREKRDLVIAMRSRGAKYDEIIAAAGVSRSTVHLYLHRAGLTKPQFGATAEEAIAIRMRRRGAKWDEIKASTGMNERAIAKALKKARMTKAIKSRRGGPTAAPEQKELS